MELCGQLWESWAKDVAVIAERHTTRIKALLESGEPRHKKAFAALTPGRQKGYIFQIASAKQSATRASRVEKYTPQILAGKGLND